MDLTDRIHSADLEGVRQAVAACCSLGKEFKLAVRFKLKGGSYAQVKLQGKAIAKDNKTCAIDFCIGVQPEAGT